MHKRQTRPLEGLLMSVVDRRIGNTVGGYLIEDVLGRGGMGVVYRATRASDGQQVALKLMLPELSANEDFRARFIAEAELVPMLDHPNVVPIYETGNADGELFIAMHLVEGYDLKQLIKESGTLTPAQTLSILRQAASALDSAHEMGIVHRDVKPQNILIARGDALGEKDLVFLTDFGLVRPVASESTASRTGAIFGSIQYMSPEQIEGLPVDGRTDVYSLACVAYECLTGSIPFERPNEIGVIWAHIHEEPPRVTEARSELPGGLDDVIRHAMAKHPDDRFLTCGELIDAMEDGLQKKQRQLVPTPLRPLVKRVERQKTEREVWAPNFFPELSRVRKLSNRTNWFQVGATVAALMVLAAALVQFAHPRGVAGAVADTGGAIGHVVTTAGAALGDAFADDDRSGSADTERRKPAPKRGTHPIAADRGLTDAGSALLARGGQTQQAQTDPGASTSDAASDSQTGAPLAPERLSRRIAFVSTRDGSYDIYTANRNGGDVEQLTAGTDSESSPTFSPDGSRIAFTRARPDTGPLDQCVQERVNQSCPYAQHLWVMSADGSNPVQVTTGSNMFDADPEWTPDGQAVVFTRWVGDNNADLYLATEVSPGEWHERRLTTALGNETEAAFSPDGTQLAYSGTLDDDSLWEQDDERRWDIFVISAGRARQLTNGVNGNTPTWSPDGRWLAYSTRTGIVRSRPDGSGVVQITTAKTKNDDLWPNWAPDGKTICFTKYELFDTARMYRLGVDPGSRMKVIADDPGDFDGLGDWGPAT